MTLLKILVANLHYTLRAFIVADFNKDCFVKNLIIYSGIINILLANWDME